ncbi:transposase [Nonomuraea sp. B19D2]|uniref:transposase n=1 Tax=Nonomuraea sp. B19D2 TaxID=3159561 RepID=UPI0032DA9F5B
MSPRWEFNPHIRTGRHCIHELTAHLVFLTKYRHNVFTEPMLKHCEQIMKDVCDKYECQLTEFNGVSARYLRQEYNTHVRQYLWDGHLWSCSHYAGSTADANPATVRT